MPGSGRLHDQLDPAERGGEDSELQQAQAPEVDGWEHRAACVPDMILKSILLICISCILYQVLDKLQSATDSLSSDAAATLSPVSFARSLPCTSTHYSFSRCSSEWIAGSCSRCLSRTPRIPAVSVTPPSPHLTTYSFFKHSFLLINLFLPNNDPPGPSNATLRTEPLKSANSNWQLYLY